MSSERELSHYRFHLLLLDLQEPDDGITQLTLGRYHDAARLVEELEPRSLTTSDRSL